jgi:Ni/Fe-hydrogenase subunit HybB-like protein
VNTHAQPTPISRKPLTPGVWALLIITVIGALFGAYRFLFGLQASTNLNQHYPWGIWIVADVSFIALAAGGFTTAAIAHIFHRERYHALARPALITALLGYTFACVALAADLGRYYNIWHPILPNMWQGNSALFEVGMCVMCYMVVLWAEFIPVFCERFIGNQRYPRFGRLCAFVNRVAGRVMCVLIVLGVAISCLHQSSLGHVMVLTPSKLHPLWWTPILALLFLVSAITAGFPTVIFACLCGSWALKLKPPMRMLGGLARYVPFLLMIYLGFKVGDMLIRRSYVHLGEGSRQSTMFMIEMVFGLIVPLILLLFRRVRYSPRWLSIASLLVMVGVIVNRTNVYWIGYQPANTTERYFPSLPEWGLTIGAVAALILLWRWIAIYFPVITPVEEDKGRAGEPIAPSRMRVSDAAGRVGMACWVVLAVSISSATAEPLQEPAGIEEARGSIAAPEEAANPDCHACHSCDTPTRESKCLRPCARPRRTTMSGGRGPKVVLLNQLEDAYLPVPFDHKGHADMAEMIDGCVTCHHHTPEGREHPACRTCHPIEDAQADIDKPALRGAYHQQCVNCHREWINERDCDICHRERAGRLTSGKAVTTPTKDDILSVMHRPIPEPDTDLYSRSLPITETQVVFRHREHTHRFGLKCVECHHERSCTQCHTNDDKPQRARTLAEHHGRCIRCHKHDMDLTGRKAGRCGRCHWQEGQPKPESFDHASTGWPLGRFHEGRSCRECHTRVPFGKTGRECNACHSEWSPATFDHGITGQLLDENHSEIDCEECHEDRRFDRSPACDDCHDPEDEGIAFPARRPGARSRADSSDSEANPGVDRSPPDGSSAPSGSLGTGTEQKD